MSTKPLSVEDRLSILGRRVRDLENQAEKIITLLKRLHPANAEDVGL